MRWGLVAALTAFAAAAVMAGFMAGAAGSQPQSPGIAGATPTPVPCSSDNGQSFEPCRMTLAGVVDASAGYCSESKCVIGFGEEFYVQVVMESVPVLGYVLAQSEIEFGTDLSYVEPLDDLDELLWPDCEAALFLGDSDPGVVHHGCLTGLPDLEASGYVGPLVRMTFACSSGESTTQLELLPYTASDTFGTHYVAATALPSVRVIPELDGLTVNCVDPDSIEPPAETPQVSSSATPTPDMTPPPTSETPGASPTTTPDGVVLTPTPTPTAGGTGTPSSVTPTPTTAEPGTPQPSSTATAAMTRLGDVSCDGGVDPLDAALILQLAAGLIPALPCPAGGDASGDGQVDPLDAALILQLSAGLIEELPG